MGWPKHNDKWVPAWMTIPEVSQMCKELLQCSCQKGCTSRCKCVRASLPCTVNVMPCIYWSLEMWWQCMLHVVLVYHTQYIIVFIEYSSKWSCSYYFSLTALYTWFKSFKLLLLFLLNLSVLLRVLNNKTVIFIQNNYCAFFFASKRCMARTINKIQNVSLGERERRKESQRVSRSQQSQHRCGRWMYLPGTDEKCCIEPLRQRTAKRTTTLFWR